jgi:hypothetical protein
MFRANSGGVDFKTSRLVMYYIASKSQVEPAEAGTRDEER